MKQIKNVKTLRIWIDGFTKHNNSKDPERRSFGQAVFESGERLKWHFGSKTNSESEYLALIEILTYTQSSLEGKKGYYYRNTYYPRITILSDSEFMVKQMNGEYRVGNSRMKQLYNKAQKLLAQCNFNHGKTEIQWVPRNENRAGKEF